MNTDCNVFYGTKPCREDTPVDSSEYSTIHNRSSLATVFNKKVL